MFLLGTIALITVIMVFIIILFSSVTVELYYTDKTYLMLDFFPLNITLSEFTKYKKRKKLFKKIRNSFRHAIPLAKAFGYLYKKAIPLHFDPDDHEKTTFLYVSVRFYSFILAFLVYLRYLIKRKAV